MLRIKDPPLGPLPRGNDFRCYIWSSYSGRPIGTSHNEIRGCNGFPFCQPSPASPFLGGSRGPFALGLGPLNGPALPAGQLAGQCALKKCQTRYSGNLTCDHKIHGGPKALKMPINSAPLPKKGWLSLLYLVLVFGKAHSKMSRSKSHGPTDLQIDP